jgi:hypothetical protein
MNNSALHQNPAFYKHLKNNNNRNVKRLDKRPGNKKNKRSGQTNRSFQEDTFKPVATDSR